MTKFKMHVAGPKNSLTKFINQIVSDKEKGGLKISSSKIFANGYWLDISGETENLSDLIAPNDKKFISLSDISKGFNLFIELYSLDDNNSRSHIIYRNGENEECENADLDKYWDDLEWKEIKKPITPISIDPNWKEE